VLSTTVTVLAHQGGWDEMLMVLTPVAVFVLLLWMANNRANRARDERATAEPPIDRADPGLPADPRDRSPADPTPDPSSGWDG
jgi:hypothetical protein